MVPTHLSVVLRMDKGPIRSCSSRRNRVTPPPRTKDSCTWTEKYTWQHFYVSTEYTRKKRAMTIYNGTKQITYCQIMCYKFLLVKFTPAKLLLTSFGKQTSCICLHQPVTRSYSATDKSVRDSLNSNTKIHFNIILKLKSRSSKFYLYFRFFD